MKRAQPPRGEAIIQRPLEEVMHQSMMPYSEYVILERALPRVEDGLKPVQRRILFTMHELGLSSDKPHRKCARIVGDCLGKYHPHGDTSVYDALARMAQPFVMRGMLVDGHGNFGSIDGDSPAAMRYTEARMTSLAMELLRDIDKNTVGFHLNFDDTQKEPDMLPGRYPNLLVNGASGIAVGLATNIPPHNLGEAIDGVIAQIDDPDITVDGLMQCIPAPDFPTGGILLKDDQLRAAYETGRGKLQVRAKVHVEPGPSGRSLLVITEMPYQVGKSALLEKILKLSEEKKALFGGIHDIRDESDRAGMRAVIELKRDVDPERTLALLYKYSDLQATFGVNIVAIAGGKPVQMGLKEVIGHFIRHQREVVTRRTNYELERVRARAHILEGLIIAVDHLDEVIALIRASSAPKEARDRLMSRFALTEIQAQAILDMRLQRLTNLEIVSLRKEHDEIQKMMEKLIGILGSERKLLTLIKKELLEIKTRHADPRRTQIMDRPEQIPVFEEEKPVAEEAIVLVTRAGFVKRLSPKAYERAQADDAEAPRFLIRTMTDERILFFSGLGQCYPVAVAQVPECRMRDRGLALTGLLMGFDAKEALINAFALPDDGYQGDLVFATRAGQIKRSALSAYAVKKSSFAAIGLRSGDEVCFVSRAAGDQQVLMVTQRAMSICFDLAEVSATGRTTMGVKGIALAPGDRLAFALLHEFEGELLLSSDRGYMKRCLLVDFDPQARGGKGVRCFHLLKSGVNGERIAGALMVRNPYDFIALKHGGESIRLNTESIPIELKDGKGQPVVMALMDDLVEDIFPA
jgi:DNA gyrase subunit A